MGLSLASWDGLIFLLYLTLTFVLNQRRKGQPSSQKNATWDGYFLDGRKLTLPLFVSSLVSTWYGGILGVGEVNYTHGVSRWVMMGLPYYLFALFFALFLVRPLRSYRSLSLPDAWSSRLSPQIGRLGSLLLFLLTNPAPYLWMVCLLLQQLIPLPFWTLCLGVLLWTFLIQGRKGFWSVYQSNAIDFFFMFGGFILLFSFSWLKIGGWEALHQGVPSEHFQFFKQDSWQVYGTWFFMAAWTLVDPGFHQRVQAAKTEQVARWGILCSILFWFLFDFLTLSTALYAKKLFPNLESPGFCYLALAQKVLPPGILGFFFCSLFATVFSTFNSFSFLSTQMLASLLQGQKKSPFVWFYSFLFPNLLTLGISFVLVLFIPSAIELWWFLGSLFLPSLFLAFLAGLGWIKYSSPWVLGLAMSLGCFASFLFWINERTGEKWFHNFLGCQPLFASLFTLLLIFIINRVRCFFF